MERAALIVNPASGRGRGARAMPRARAAFRAVGVEEVHLTTAPRDERAVARRLLDAGFTTLAVLGGDGTWSGVAEEIVKSGSGARMAMLAAGTGNDFVKSAGVPSGDFERTARLCVDGPSSAVDVASIDGRHFVNVAGFGFDAEVLAATMQPTLLRGHAVYLAAAVRKLFGYRGLRTRRNGGSFEPQLLLAIANGSHFGGAFHIAPDASIRDGILDLVAIGNADTARRVRLFAAAVRGAHCGLPGVVTERAPAYTLTFEEPPLFEADGELYRASSDEVEVRCVPGALKLVGVGARGPSAQAAGGALTAER